MWHIWLCKLTIVTLYFDWYLLLSATSAWYKDHPINVLIKLKKPVEEKCETILNLYKEFQKSIPEFLIALKMSKPMDMLEIRTQGDLLKCHNILQRSPSVGKNVQTELLHHYITMVDALSEMCDDINSDLKQWRDITQIFQDYEAISPSVGILRTMLEPLFDFSALQSAMSVKLNVMDKKVFSGLLSYIPVVLEKVDELVGIIASRIEVRNNSQSHSSRGD